MLMLVLLTALLVMLVLVTALLPLLCSAANDGLLYCSILLLLMLLLMGFTAFFISACSILLMLLCCCCLLLLLLLLLLLMLLSTLLLFCSSQRELDVRAMCAMAKFCQHRQQECKKRQERRCRYRLKESIVMISEYRRLQIKLYSTEWLPCSSTSETNIGRHWSGRVDLFLVATKHF
jgi:hypothetical protein